MLVTRFFHKYVHIWFCIQKLAAMTGGYCPAGNQRKTHPDAASRSCFHGWQFPSRFRNQAPVASWLHDPLVLAGVVVVYIQPSLNSCLLCHQSGGRWYGNISFHGHLLPSSGGKKISWRFRAHESWALVAPALGAWSSFVPVIFPLSCTYCGGAK